MICAFVKGKMMSKIINVDVDVYIQREFSEVHDASTGGSFKTLTMVEYECKIVGIEENLYELFENRFKAQLAIEIPDKKKSFTEAQITEVMDEEFDKFDGLTVTQTCENIVKKLFKD